MTIQIRQTAREQGPNWYQWAVWLEGDRGELEQVNYVDYILHATFPQPVQRIDDRGNGFRLEASGWGEFMIYLHIYLKDGQVLQREHWLSLQSPVETGSPAASASSPQTVYLSAAAADTGFASALAGELQKLGMEVVTSQDLGPGSSLEDSMSSHRGRFNAAIFLVSEVRNPWLAREIEAFKKWETPRIAVLVGVNSRLPAELRGAPVFPLKDLQESRMAAQSIAGRLRGQKA
jgi:hypothetical protein